MGGRGATYSVSRAIVGNYEVQNVMSNTERIQDVFKALDNMNNPIRIQNGRTVVTRQAIDAIDSAAAAIARDVRIRDLDAEQEYRELRNETKGRYYLSQQDRADLTDFSARQSIVRTTNDRNATSIDSLYQELADSHPQYFGNETHPADQLRQINSVLNRLKNSSMPLHGDMLRETQNELASDIMRTWYSLRH